MGESARNRLRFLATKSESVPLNPAESRELYRLLAAWEADQEYLADESRRGQCGALLAAYDEPTFPRSDAAF